MSTWRGGLRKGEGGFYFYRFRLKGKLHQGNTGCQGHKDAAEWVRRFKTNLSMGEVGIREAPTIKTACAAWLDDRRATGKSDKHLARAESAFRLHIIPAIGHIEADQLGQSDITALLDRYLGGKSNRAFGGKKRSAHGANTVLLYLRAVLLFLVERGYLKSMPVKLTMLPTREPVRAVVPVERAGEFFAAIDCTRNLHQMLACRLMFWMGYREAEALGLRWEWIAWDMATITHGMRKSKRAKPLPTNQTIRVLLWAILHEHHEGQTQLGGLVLVAEDGKAHRPKFTRKAVERAGKALKIDGLSPHRLRASFATNLARQGVSAHLIRDAMDYADIKTSEHYVRLAASDLGEALGKLNDAARAKC